MSTILTSQSKGRIVIQEDEIFLHSGSCVIEGDEHSLMSSERIQIGVLFREKEKLTMQREILLEGKIVSQDEINDQTMNQLIWSDIF